MSIALDIGTQNLRSLRREGGRLVGRKNQAVYLSLQDRPIQRRILDKASIRYATCAGSLLVIGQTAHETAEMLHEPCIPLMCEAHLPQADPVARQVLTSLVDCLLPLSTIPGEVCWTNIPGAIDSETNERRFFTQLIRLRGYEPRFVSAGLAVVLAELGQNGFSGIGCDFGAGNTRVSLARHGVELLTIRLEKGGDWIDAGVAESERCILWDSEGNRYLDSAAITRWKQGTLVSVLKPISEREQRLSLLCEELIRETLSAMRRQFAGQRCVASLREPLPLVVSGGLSRLPGFRELLLDMVRDTDLGVDISEVRRCADPDYTIARGCLILSELEAAPDITAVA